MFFLSRHGCKGSLGSSRIARLCHLHAFRADEAAALFEVLGIPKRPPITARWLNKIRVRHKLATVCKSQTGCFCVKVQPIGRRQTLLKLHCPGRSVVQNAQHLPDGQCARTGWWETAKLIGLSSCLHQMIKAQRIAFFGFVIGQILHCHVARACRVLSHFFNQGFGHRAILQSLGSTLCNVAHDSCQLGIFQDVTDGVWFALRIVKVACGDKVID